MSFRRTFKEYHYATPSVQEAIFEVRFSPENWDSAIPGQIYERVKGDYPEKRDLKVLTVFLGATGSEVSPQIPPPQAPSMQLWNREKTQLLQVGPAIVTANSVKYSRWEDFLPAISLILKTYFDLGKPRVTTRIGTRYINRFLLEQDEIDVSKFFNVNLGIPQPLQESYAFELTFLKRIKELGPNLPCEVRTRFATDSIRPGETGAAFLLDIDCFSAGDLNLSIEELIEAANSFHEVVGDIFESFLKDKLRSIFGGKLK